MSDFDAILARLPSLARLLETSGSMSLFEYAQKYYHSIENEDVLFQSRKQEFLGVLQMYITKQFDRSLADTVVDTLKQNYAVSTAEHHGPMGHPFFFQSALLRAIARPDLPVINFATSHVSLGNSSYPRGLIFHGDGIKAPQEYLHLPFFGSKSRMCPVFHFPAYTRNDIITHCIGRLKAYKRLQYISEPLYAKLYDFIQAHVLEPSILALPTYSEQITRLNHLWWHQLFPELPEYISLDAEEITNELLIYHIDHQTPLGRKLFADLAIHSRIEEAFDGIQCCFGGTSKTGTYLFWYLDSHHYRHPLWRIGDELVSPDGNFRIDLTFEGISEHLKNHQIVPSGLLVYSILSCYYGITCFGGFSQGDYLSQIQNAYLTTIESVDSHFMRQSSILNENMVFLFEENGEISTALDMYTQKGGDIDYKRLSQGMSLSTSIHQMQFEIGRCF